MDILLYATENPRNLGSIIRTSVCFDLPKIHLYDKHKLLESKESTETIDAICRRDRRSKLDIVNIEDPEGFVDSYTHKYATLLSPKSKRLGDPEDNFKFHEDGLIIFGCEDYGLPRKISRREGVQKFAVPTVSPVECFGVAEAYAIVLYEALKNIKKLPKY